MPIQEPLRITALVASVLEDLGIPYLVGGSIASSLHGIPRATQDVDLVADLQESLVDALVARLEGSFYIDAEMIRDAIVRRASFNVIHLESMLKVDVFVLRRDAFSRAEMERRSSIDVDEAGHALWFASPEDVLLHKLVWYRDGSEVSDRQWNDALGVLKVRRPDIDLAYLRHWAPRLGVEDLLVRLMHDAGFAEEVDPG